MSCCLCRMKRTMGSHYYPGSDNMTSFLTKMTFLLLWLISLVALQPASCIEADVQPVDPIIEVGTDQQITCTLTNATGSHPPGTTAHDVVWYQDATLIPAQQYHIVNSQVSKIMLHNVSLDECGTYYCALRQDNDVTDYEGTVLQVGLMPQPVSSFTCMSHNVWDYYCEWVAVETHIPETHIFTYKHNSQWQACNPQRTEPNRCTVEMMDGHSGSMQQVRVTSTNALGSAKRDDHFDPIRETITLPLDSVRVTAMSSSSLHVDWDIPPTWYSFMDSPKYRLRWSSQYDTHQWTTQDPVTSVYEIQHLAAYTNYSVQVASQYTLSDGDWSDWSDVVWGKTGEDDPTGKVQNLRISDMVDNSDDEAFSRDVTLIWEPLVEREQNGPILGYHVMLVPAQECLVQDGYNATVSYTRTVIEGLEKFCSYRATVQAYNSIGPGPAEVVDIQDMTSVPSAPYNVSARTLTHQSVSVNWTDKVIQGHVMYYTVHWVETKGQDTGKSQNVGANSTSVIIEDLEGYILYNFKVSETNKIGTSGLSDTAQARTLQWVPEASPMDLMVDEVPDDPSSLSLDWTDVSEEDAHGIILGHNIYYCMLSGAECVGQGSAPFPVESRRPVKLSGLVPFTQYHVWLSAYTSVGEGPWSDSSLGMTGEGAPSEPLQVTITGVTASSISIAWNTPVEHNGVLRDYKVLVKSNVSTGQDEYHAGVEESFTVEGLYGYEYYLIQVQACTTVCGPPAEAVYQQTHIGVPGAPESLDVRSTAENVVHLTWQPPIHSNGPISHYILTQYRLEEENASCSDVGDPLTWMDVRGTEETVNIECEEETEDGTRFFFCVNAVNMVDDIGLVGDAAGLGRTECIYQATSLSPLIWLVLPAGAILLFALLTSLYYVQTKLGKSWPEPVFIDIVKNRKGTGHVPKTKNIEKEEFDSIRVSVSTHQGGLCDDATVAEEFPAHSFCHAIPTSLSDEFIGKNGHGSKDGFLRTVSVDSGVPPSPQDQAYFSSSDDVFHLDSKTSEWPDCTYSFDHSSPSIAAKAMALTLGKGGRRKRSTSFTNSDLGNNALPAIKENGMLDSLAVKYTGGAYVEDRTAVPCISTCQVDHRGSNNEAHSGYSSVSDLPLPSMERTQPGTSRSQIPLNDDSDEEPDLHDIELTPIETPSSGSIALGSGYVSHTAAYCKMGKHLNQATEETSFMSGSDITAVDGGYIASSITYSVLSTPQIVSEPRSSAGSEDTPMQVPASPYVSGDSIPSYSQLVTSQMVPEAIADIPSGERDAESPYISSDDSLIYSKMAAGNEASIAVPSSQSIEHPGTPYVGRDESLTYSKMVVGVATCSIVSTPQTRESPTTNYVSRESVIASRPEGTLKAVAHLDCQKESPNLQTIPSSSMSASQPKFTSAVPDLTNQLADYVRGADLASLQTTSMTLESPLPSSSRLSLIYPNEISVPESSNHCSKGDGENGEETQKVALGGEVERRHRNESSSSSSGYVSDSGGHSFTSQSGTLVSSDQEHDMLYANLAFSSSESDVDSDLDSGTHTDSVHGSPPVTVIGPGKGASLPDTSFVEYVGYCPNGQTFVNDFPMPACPANEPNRSTSEKVCDVTSEKLRNGITLEEYDNDAGYVTCRSVNTALEAPYVAMNTGLSDCTQLYQVPNKSHFRNPPTDASPFTDDDGYVPTNQDMSSYVPFNGDSSEYVRCNGKSAGYVPCSADVSGYVIRAGHDHSKGKEEYMPMAPLKNGHRGNKS